MKAHPPLQIIAPNRRQHREALVDFWSKIFGFGSDGRYFTGQAFCRAGYLDGSHYDWDTSRIGLVDGQIVTHYGVWGYGMRVGSATVRCGGVGAVSTHPDFRKRGYLMKTANASIDAMRAGGYDLSLLFGIDGFYDRLGYVRVFSYHQHYLKTADLPTEKPEAAARKFKLVQREDTDRLYNHTFAGFTGTAVRPTFTKAGDIRGEAFRWSDGRGRLAGYVYIKHDEANRRMKCFEAVGEPTQVLRVLGQLTRKHGCVELELLNQPIHTPLMQRVRRGRHEVATVFNPNGGPMTRTLNLHTTLTKIAGELHARLRGSSMAKWTGTLRIDDGQEKASLRITPSKVTVASPAPGAKTAKATAHTIKTRGHAMQLVFGTDASEVLMREAKMKATGDAAALVAALFPNQDPMLLTFDHF